MLIAILIFAMQVSAATMPVSPQKLVTSKQTLTPDTMKNLDATVFKDADIEFKNANGRYRIQADSIEIKKNEIVATGKTKFTVIEENKGVLSIEALPPENELKFDTTKGLVTSAAGKMKFKKENYEGRGVDANLEKRKVSWVQMVNRNGKVVKAVLDLKF